MKNQNNTRPTKRRETFADEMKDYLGTYRTKVLNREKMGNWRKLPKPHILTEEDKSMWNYLPAVRSELAQYVQENSIKLHQYFAHLNSSQALALNLFFPLLPEQDSNLSWGNPSHISRLLERPDQQIKTGKFEAILDQVERTNFDWVAHLSGGGWIFCEVKYTESSFGSATSKTTDYMHRFEKIYQKRLEGVVHPDRLDRSQLDWFKKNYQILRNLSYLKWGDFPDKNRVIFVLPERSPSFQQLQRFIEKEVEPDVKNKVIVKGIAAWATELKSHSASETETKHWKDFSQKYIPHVSAQ